MEWNGEMNWNVDKSDGPYKTIKTNYACKVVEVSLACDYMHDATVVYTGKIFTVV